MVYRLAANRTLDEFLQFITKNSVVYALEKAGEQYHLVRAAKWEPQRHVLGAFRAIEPLKALVFPPRQRLSALAGTNPAPQKRAVIGVKGCDVSSLKIHDYVWLADPADPDYKQARENTLIISSDCTAAGPTCFCTAVREQPYAREGFDLNFSSTGQGLLVETGSPLGEQTAQEAAAYLQEAPREMVRERDRVRQEITQKVADQAAAQGLAPDRDFQAAIRGSGEKALWGEFAQDCVECGACNFVCCTCHCFLLSDGQTPEKRAGRIKQWDSCLYLNFARVAGGANPRKHRAERLFNRFEKKFVFFPQVLGRYACDGCGRCAEACTGKIDIRSVLKRALA